MSRIPFKPFTRVIVATDFSRHASSALRRAVHLPLARGASVELVHVLPAKVPGAFRQGIEEDAWAQLRRGEARGRKMLHARRRPDVDLRSELARGDVAREVDRLGRMDHIDLIVVGRTAERSTRRPLRASVAERILRTGCAPVLIVSRSSSAPYHHPVVALDLDHEPAQIVRAAFRVAGPGRTPLTALTSYNHSFELYLRQLNAPVSQIEAYRARCRREVEAHAEEVLSTVEGARERLRFVLHPDEPRAAIRQVAQTEEADLLVLGTHARKGTPRLLLGSVATAVVRDARCDVLIVPSPAPAVGTTDVSMNAGHHGPHDDERGITLV